MRVEVEAGVAVAAGQRGGDRAQVRLRGEAAHRGERAIDDVAAGLDGGQHRGGGDAAGVVGVEVDRQADLLLQRAYQFARGARLAHAGHVLDGQDVRAGLLQFLGQLDVVLQVVLRPRRVEHVAGVADRRLAERAGLDARRPSRRACCRPSSASRRRGRRRCRPWPPAGRSSARRCRDSWCSRPRWRRAAASGTGCSARLRAGVRSRSHGSSFRKRIATSKVAPPQHSSENRSGQHARVVRRDLGQVVGAHARGEQRLVRVAHRGVGEQHAAARRASSRRTSSAPSCLQPVARAGRRHRCDRSQCGGLIGGLPAAVAAGRGPSSRGCR